MKPFIVAVVLTVLGNSVFAASCSKCSGIDGFVPPDSIADEIYAMVGKLGAIGHGAGAGAVYSDREKVKIQKQRGAIVTRTRPAFVNGGSCPTIDSETWAKDYTTKRGKPALHKGIDIPQPRGTPVLAAAAGTVVGKFRNKRNRKGIEVVLRHTPQQTGLPFYTYTQYTHLLEMSPLPIGTRVDIGAEIGKISNTGKQGQRVRRDALHFAVMYSEQPYWSNDGTVVAPKDSYWMDPVMFFSESGPYDSGHVKNRRKKTIDTSYVTTSGQVVPTNAHRIWPFSCK